ncbi:MAG: S1 RNA-binding domain-containing protein [bacterium]|nr:S1 RNA-binding domain-containing protein [bacterium]
MTNYASSIMDELLEDATDIKLPVPGFLVDGVVVAVMKNKVLVDLGGMATGIIAGQETQDSSDTIKTLKEGDTVSSYILEEENEDGLVVLSLRKASQQKTWNKFLSAHESGESITVSANEANKGGLLLNVDGIKGFIPVSQLAPLHYPRVNGADSAQILTRLQKLIGLPLLVKIINLDRESGKLILSERAAESEKRKGSLEKLDVGQKLLGKISGIVNFGIFVTFNGLEGLVHISEIAWGHVKDPNDYGKLGDEVEVLVIGKEKDKISLSMKRLVPDPWVDATKKYKVGTVVNGEVNRITPFGAFVKLDEEINGLIHISEIAPEGDGDPAETLNVGDKIKAKIIAIDPDDHRVGLSIKSLDEKPKKAKKDEEALEESDKASAEPEEAEEESDKDSE